MNRILLVSKTALSRARTWPGKVVLIVIIVATLALVAFLNPISESDSRTDSQKAQLANGWVTNCEGPAFNKLSRRADSGSGSNPVFRINDQLVLAVPRERIRLLPLALTESLANVENSRMCRWQIFSTL